MTKRSAIAVENLRLQARQNTWHKQELFKGRNHITPWLNGGRTIPSNYQMLCKDCNRRKGPK